MDDLVEIFRTEGHVFSFCAGNAALAKASRQLDRTDADTISTGSP